MPYIIREDGERFIIPSYRDVLSAKKPNLLRKEILLLSSNYGEYITLQRKNVDQYEAAFSPDPGYLLGESVWHYFKRPLDLIYCEAIPNTTEAILVIVKAGSVYLDGSFPIDSIPDELVAFKTQQNNFDIYIYGDIPISQQPEEGKFSLDTSSVKSFTVLSAPVFPTLPSIKTFQLRLVDAVLKAQGIGAVPVKRIVLSVIFLALLWGFFVYFTGQKKELPRAIVGVVNPYQIYVGTLTSPAPMQELKQVTRQIALLYTIPGWQPSAINYSAGKLEAQVKSSGIRTSVLFQWAAKNGASLKILPNGIYLGLRTQLYNRPSPRTISPLQQVIAELLDRIAYVLPGNHLKLGASIDRGSFSEAEVTLSFTGLTLNTLDLIAEQLKDLPLILSKVDIDTDHGNLSGSLIFQALGS